MAFTRLDKIGTPRLKVGDTVVHDIGNATTGEILATSEVGAIARHTYATGGAPRREYVWLRKGALGWESVRRIVQVNGKPVHYPKRKSK